MPKISEQVEISISTKHVLYFFKNNSGIKVGFQHLEWPTLYQPSHQRRYQVTVPTRAYKCRNKSFSIFFHCWVEPHLLGLNHFIDHCPPSQHALDLVIDLHKVIVPLLLAGFILCCFTCGSFLLLYTMVFHQCLNVQV